MVRRETDDGMHVAKLPQPNTVLVMLSDHRFKIFLFRSKKHLRLSGDETYSDLLTSLTHSFFRKLKFVKIRRNENNLVSLEVMYTFQAKELANK